MYVSAYLRLQQDNTAKINHEYLWHQHVIGLRVSFSMCSPDFNFLVCTQFRILVYVVINFQVHGWQWDLRKTNCIFEYVACWIVTNLNSWCLYVLHWNVLNYSICLNCAVCIIICVSCHVLVVVIVSMFHHALYYIFPTIGFEASLKTSLYFLQCQCL